MYLSLSFQCLPAVCSVSILKRGKVNICQSVGYWDNFVAGLCSVLYVVFIHQVRSDCTFRSQYKTILQWYFTLGFGWFTVPSKTI